MGFEVVDRYLLGEPVSKAAVLEALLAERSPLAAAAPFYRALEAVGVRAADEAFIALRIVVAGRELSDERVRRVRALASVARIARNGDPAALAALFQKEAAVLTDLLPPEPGAVAGVREAAERAFAAELSA